MQLRPFIRWCVAAAALTGLLGSCDGGKLEAEPTLVTPATPTVGGVGSPAPPGEELTGHCVNGFTIPAAGDPLREEALRALTRGTGVRGEWRVEEIRYFEGPEAPPSERDYALVVKRWYVKAEAKDDPSFRARWLIEQRTFGTGVVAVAPFETTGFRSPDWVGFQYEGPDVEPTTYPGLPGEWAGTPYDFATGKNPATGEKVFGFPGLPEEVIGCLAGT